MSSQDGVCDDGTAPAYEDDWGPFESGRRWDADWGGYLSDDVYYGGGYDSDEYDSEDGYGGRGYHSDGYPYVWAAQTLSRTKLSPPLLSLFQVQ